MVSYICAFFSSSPPSFICFIAAFNEYDEPGESGNTMYDIDFQNADRNAVQDLVTEKPMIAQKKGQSEYVEFIEPKMSNQMKHVETVEKRVLADNTAVQKTSGFKPMLHAGNFLFLGLLFD